MLVSCALSTTITAQPQDDQLFLQVDDAGAIMNLHWPSPGMFSQMALRVGDPPGLRWGILEEETILWIGKEDWVADRLEQDVARGTFISHLKHSTRDIRVEVITQLGRSGSGFTSTVEIAGVNAPTLVWYADFDPTAYVLPESSNGYTSRTKYRDYGASVARDSKTTIHFRPDAIGREKSAKVKRWMADGRSFDDWGDLGDGTWIGITSPQHVILQVVSSKRPKWGSMLWREAILDLKNTGHDVALGDTHSLLVCEGQKTDDGYVASVQVAFAHTRSDVQDLLRQDLVPKTEKATPKNRRFPNTRPDVTALAEGLTDFIGLHQDEASGAIFASTPGHMPATPVDVVHACYTLYALGLAGRRDLGDSLAEYLARQVYQETDGHRPMGSVSRLRYSSGIPAEPEYRVELFPAASIIWALNEYAMQLPLRGRRDFLHKHQDALESMADFIDQWSRPILDQLPRVAGLNALEAAPYLDELAAARLGLNSGAQVFEAMGKEVPLAWIETNGRAFRATSTRGMYIYAPWDIEIGRRLNHYIDIRRFERRGSLSAYLDTQSEAKKRFTVLSIAYQTTRTSSGGRLGPELIAPTVDRYFGQDLSTVSWNGRDGEAALLLVILYKSYQSTP
ncbi:MAG: hypothetical protein VCD00_16165 [Candidatus Hydrogenedentota bacterium]